jgi:two-component system, OmpR family, torCAD operon response regulator TorR
MDQRHVVVVEDEPAMRAILAGHFSNDGYRVSTAADGHELQAVLDRDKADLISLDIRLPGEDGISLLRRLRAVDDRGIIVVTARADSIDRIVALELGADDYVTKPFNERELLARARNIIRRTYNVTPSRLPDQLAFHGWQLDRRSREVRDPDGRRVHLTRGEFDLLVALLDNAGSVIPRSELVKALGHRSARPTERTVDVMIGRLRRKIEQEPSRPRLIETAHGIGYVFRRS